MGNMISCITTTYNRPKELERCIKSVDNQSNEDWEHIIVHDGPASQETKDVIAKYKRKNRKFIELKENHGNHTKPKNEGIKASKGEYICYLDDDNEYLPSFMDTLKMELELSGVDVVYGLERIYQDENDERGSEAISFPFDPQLLLRRSYIDTNVVLHRREAVDKVGGWDEKLPRFADWNLFVRMTKAGVLFKQVPILVTKYYMTKGNSAEKYPVKSWIDPQTQLRFFDPTWFNPAGCDIFLGYLGENKKQTEPKVVIFSLWYERPEYSMQMAETMKASGYPYELVVVAQTPEDAKLARKYTKHVIENKNNVGLTKGSNQALDYIEENFDAQIIGKVDNDCIFLTQGWLKDIVSLWKKNHLFYMGLYPEGLVDHPGGPWRVGYGAIDGNYIELTDHISGICAFIDASAYKNWRWEDKFLHGQQDGEASAAFIKRNYSCVILPNQRIQHAETTSGQQKRYKEYFKRRKNEKTTQV